MKPNFKIEENIPYADNGVTTSISEDVLLAMMPYLQESYGDPDEPYAVGVEAKDVLEEARRDFADLVGCESKNIWFTSGGTESNNWAIRCQDDLKYPICSSIEHLSVLRSVESKKGFVAPVDENGRMDVDDLKVRLGTGEVSVVSLQFANQDTGIMQDLSEVAEACMAASVPFHVDAAMSFGIEPIHMDDMGIDFLTLSSHKVWGPVGGGLLASSGRYELKPLLLGGEQEGGMRAGPVNMAVVAGFLKAAHLTRSNREGWKNVKKLRDTFELNLKEVVGAVTIGGNARRLSNMSMISFPNSDASFLAAEMERMHKACIGIGGTAEKGSASRVLEAMGFKRTVRESTLRFRFSPWFDKRTAGILTCGICSALREERGRQIV